MKPTLKPAADDREPETEASDAVAGRDLEAARRVLRQEIDGLAALGASLDHTFGRALNLLDGISGRITVTGMGKSGHVARKIAATLASTGAPAQFVHPGEASHGDLGMIAPGDAVVALSNSGETPELSDIITYTRRFAIPLVAITGGADSALAQAADVALILPKAPEACPMGLAPTTSTTMMLALGDAVAIALLERKGFTAQDFQRLHPGGALGRRLLHVADIMHGADELPLCRPDTLMAEAILTMTERRFGCVGVIDGDGALIGIITDGDLRRNMTPRLLDLAAREVMTRQPRTISPQALAAEALGIMNGLHNERRITSLFVVDGARPVGIVHIHDCLRAGVA
ncbi:MAG: KpsF/GutQ family sugar-phosphate isomerase [Planctomycetota bacterium]|nr:MAG: KpsF/GutQ family sugar-phosphate isomerase [Planctomycetota bacterium]